MFLSSLLPGMARRARRPIGWSQGRDGGMRSERQQGPAGKGLVGHFKDFGAFFFLMSIFERERESGGGAGREKEDSKPALG